MAKAAKKAGEQTGIEIMELRVGRLRCNIVGTAPMIMHRFPRKAWEELLFPKGRKNAAERESSLKHDPVSEFRETIYQNRDYGEPALIHMPTGAFNKAMADAALDIPGATKSQIMRLTKVVTPNINLFGVPRLYCAMVRSSDMAKTPDVRTRAIFPRWACTIDVQYVSTLTKEGQIVNLLAAAGLIVGVGDWRSQKGGSFGSFRVAGDDDKEFREIVKTEGRKAQAEAIKNPVAYDADSEELLRWFFEEAKRRERVVPSSIADERSKRATGKKKRGASGDIEVLEAAE